MLPVMKILVQVIVQKFYERNVGLFFFIFYLMFGIVESTQIITYHLSLIYGVLSSSVFLLMVCGVWVLYSLKYLQFIFAEFDKPQNLFLIELSRLDRTKLFWILLVTVATIDAPVLIYSFFIVSIGVKSHHYLPTLAIIGFHLGALLTATFILLKRLNSIHEKASFSFFPAIHWRWPKPLSIFYLGQLTNQLPTVLFFTKAFSVFAVYGFMQIPLDHYENRVAVLGLLIGLAGHAVIVFELRKFEEETLRFLRGIPLSIPERFLKIATVYGILLLPEIIMLTIRGVHLIDLIGIILFATGYLTLNHCKLLKSELNMDNHIQWTLGLFLISFMLVLLKVHLVEMLLIWALSYYWLNRDYYKFESS